MHSISVVHTWHEWLRHIRALLILSCTNLSLWNHCESVLYSSFRSTLTSYIDSTSWDKSSFYHSSKTWYIIAVIHRHIKCHLLTLTFVSLDTVSHILHLESHEGHEINTLWNIKFRSSSHLRYINHHWDIISFHTHRLRAYWYKRLKLPWNFTRLVHWLVPWYHRNLFDVYYRNILRRLSSTIWCSCTQSHKYETCLCLCLKREHLEASWHRTNSRIDRACQAFQRLMLLDLRQATQDCFLALILKSALPASIWTCVTNTNLNSWAEKVSHR